MLGQVVGQQRIALRQRHPALDEVCQLAHIAGEVVFRQILHRLGVDLAHVLAHQRRKFMQKEIGEQRHVVATLAQRRQRQGHHIEAEIQIVAQVPGLHRFLQVAVARCHHAHVERHRLDRPDAQHFALLQHTQQLDLDRMRQLGHFVEKQRAALRGFEQPDLA